MMSKKLFKGTFNWYGEIHTLHTNAGNVQRALFNFMVQLSVKLNRTQSSIRYYFNDGKDRWNIKEIVKDD